MAKNAGNLLISNATIYVAQYGAIEPAQTLAALNAAPAASAWTEVGLTQGGVTLSITPDYAALEADQIRMRAGSVQTGEEVTVEMSLAEVTLENLVLALAHGSITSVDTGNVSVFTPGDATDFQVNYRSLILDGNAPAGLQGATKRRRVILRRCIPSEGVELAYSKEDQQVFNITWMLHYIDDVTPPYVILEDASTN